MTRGPGQPRLRDGEETVVLRFRISETDRALIRRAAEAAGTSVSQLVRDAALEAAKERLYEMPEDDPCFRPAPVPRAPRSRGERANR